MWYPLKLKISEESGITALIFKDKGNMSGGQHSLKGSVNLCGLWNNCFTGRIMTDKSQEMNSMSWKCLSLITSVWNHIYFLTGRILNVESQEMKFHEWGVGVDPDESCWVESVKFNISFLVVIRVFYEVGPPAYEEVGKCRQVFT